VSQAMEFRESLWNGMPAAGAALGICPALAVTTSVSSGLGMGIVTTLVLISSGLVASVTRRVVPGRVKIMFYLAVIAAFATLADSVMTGHAPQLRQDLGIFVPLIAANCLVLGRVQSFAGKSGLAVPLLSALGLGLGFTLALASVSLVREMLGTGGVWGINIVGGNYDPMRAAVLAPGAFIVLGLVAGLLRLVKAGRTGRSW
jgi:electron transport complex protein RnfE